MAFSLSDNSYILALHNDVRREVGVGPLEWDSSLENYAKNLLLHSRNQCYPDVQSNRYGMNLGRSSSARSGFINDDYENSTLGSWIDEKDVYGIESNSCVAKQECMHYTQMVWHSSDRLGCAAVSCKSSETTRQVTLLCLYDPPGNAAGEYPYAFQCHFAFNSSSWKNNLSIEQRNWVFTDGSTYRPILLTANGPDNPPFGFGFFTDGSKGDTFYLVIFSLKISSAGLNANKNLSSINLLDPPVIFWSANRDNPVRENATLDFTSKGDMLLKDSDGSLVWSTNTSGFSVVKMSLTAQGNLVLENSTGHTVWQSFDHPTDTLLPNQVLSVGKTLVARNSSSSLASGQFYLTATPGGIDAFIGLSSPQQYRAYQLSKFLKLRNLSNDIAFIEKLLNGLRFNVSADPELGLPYVVLEPNGHLTMRRNCDHRQSQPLIDIVKERAEQNQLFDFIDQHFQDDQSYREDAEKMVKIGLCCLQAHNRRPPMSLIVKVLEGGLGLEFITTNGLLNITEVEAPLTVSSRAAISSYTPTASVLSGPR
nr:G-type lectin S-receptor-like serine/threonine-protein kinase SD2-5 [Ipomoea batatas]